MTFTGFHHTISGQGPGEWRHYEGSQVAAEADLASAITSPIIAAPSHGLVEGDPLLVAFDRPEYRLTVAVCHKVNQGE